MTTLFLVRHAETTSNAENRYSGASEVELTAVGHEQARLLAEWSVRIGLSAVWSSPMSRCRLTAIPSAEATGSDVQIDDRLRELDFGHIDGMTTADIRTSYPDVMDAFLRDPVANHFPGGEPPQDAAGRAIECLNEIAEAHPDSRVLVVAHSTLFRLALCQLLGIGLSGYRAKFPYLDNCAVSEIRIRSSEAAILSYNIPVGSIVAAKKEATL